MLQTGSRDRARPKPEIGVTVFEIDVLAVENSDNASTKSGDAIAVNLTLNSGTQFVAIIDGGYIATGQNLVDLVEERYNTTHVDLVINTHPDKDHINGLKTVLEECTVTELMMHLPWNHTSGWKDLSNIEAVVDLYDLAISKGVTVTEPFTGLTRADGAIRIAGPTRERYDILIEDAVQEERSGIAASRRSAAFGSGSTLVATAKRVLEKVLTYFPFETLTDVDDTSPRNQTSVITILQIDGKRVLFTGDAGIESLAQAASHYEAHVGDFSTTPLTHFQAPHHGSHHNLGPTILNRIVGAKDTAGFGSTQAIVSSAKLSEKHPSPKVTNAMGRRGATVYATEGNGIWFHSPGMSRLGWGNAPTVGPLEESDD